MCATETRDIVVVFYALKTFANRGSGGGDMRQNAVFYDSPYKVGVQSRFMAFAATEYEHCVEARAVFKHDYVS